MYIFFLEFIYSLILVQTIIAVKSNYSNFAAAARAERGERLRFKSNLSVSAPECFWKGPTPLRRKNHFHISFYLFSFPLSIFIFGFVFCQAMAEWDVSPERYNERIIYSINFKNSLPFVKIKPGFNLGKIPVAIIDILRKIE